MVGEPVCVPPAPQKPDRGRRAPRVRRHAPRSPRRASAQERPGRRGILVVQVEGAIDPPNAELVTDAIAARQRRATDDGDPPGRLQEHPRHVGRCARRRGATVARPGRRLDRARGSEGAGWSRAPARGGAGRRSPPPAPTSVRRTRSGSTSPTRRRSRRCAPSSPRSRRTTVATATAQRDSRPDPSRPRTPAASGAHRRSAPDARRDDRHARRQDRSHRRRRCPPLHREGHRRGTRPASPAEPGGRVRQPRGRRQVRHALLGPATAYFLFVVGLALIVFEFFAASVGFAAAVGAICVDLRGVRVRRAAGPRVGDRPAPARVVRVRRRRAGRRSGSVDRRSVSCRSERARSSSSAATRPCGPRGGSSASSSSAHPSSTCSPSPRSSVPGSRARRSVAKAMIGEMGVGDGRRRARRRRRDPRGSMASPHEPCDADQRR